MFVTNDLVPRERLIEALIKADSYWQKFVLSFQEWAFPPFNCAQYGLPFLRSDQIRSP